MQYHDIKLASSTSLVSRIIEGYLTRLMLQSAGTFMNGSPQTKNVESWNNGNLHIFSN
jgi:hypothetical protein